MATDIATRSGDWERFDRRKKLLRYFGLLGTLIVTLASWQALGVRYTYLETAPEMTFNLFQRMYPPDTAYAPEIVAPMIATVNIAVVGTMVAILMAIPVAYLGARNTTPNRYTYSLGKFLIVASRSVHVIIWALIFVILFGTGTLAGILSVAFRSIGFLAKLLSEEIEEIDETALEAIQATGAGRLETMMYGVVPQVKPAFIGISVYRWDINVREATIIGFVGAGGIGMELQTRINFFDWNGVLTILIAILLVVMFSELFSAYVRKKVR
ncbi:phosphonate transport system permease protein [Halorubrum alkaliphilum]|uniref:Phosphonate transport system permease protein n=1 Tax=Halorubrum alkaliphilum TaxID=261290 RepID=A0A8T4GGD2_9EURY|nr:phosphonate ABC transporter, permease protein PhnE [Halorubrum alkaliphilum]MBP1923594.1 phosphonate transport system permease protein [Halorubrum alkaliphilum]